MCPWRRDVEMSQRLDNMDFILYGREGGALVGGVFQLKYLGHTLEQTY